MIHDENRGVSEYRMIYLIRFGEAEPGKGTRSEASENAPYPWNPHLRRPLRNAQRIEGSQ